MLQQKSNSYLPSDEELVLSYKTTADNYYVGVLFERYTAIIFGICLKYFKNRQEAEDNMLEIYEKLETQLKVKEVDRFRNWLFVLVKNFCVSKLRSVQSLQKKKQAYENYVRHLNIDSNESKDASVMVESELLNSLMQKLPQNQALCIDYFYFQNKTYKEIASIIDVDINKVRSYIQNGRRNLKKMIVNEK